MTPYRVCFAVIGIVISAIISGNTTTKSLAITFNLTEQMESGVGQSIDQTELQSLPEYFRSLSACVYAINALYIRLIISACPQSSDCSVVYICIATMAVMLICRIFNQFTSSDSEIHLSWPVKHAHIARNNTIKAHCYIFQLIWWNYLGII